VGDEINPGPKFFRRKRRFQGATWTPGSISAATEDGVWCASCRMRHGYGATKRLGLTYEKGSSGHWKLMWYCKLTGNVLKEQELGEGHDTV
jgi:hypothetical protein